METEINKRIIVVTGTPGVGKTSASRLLASELSAIFVSLGELVEKEKLYSRIDRKRGSVIANTSSVSKRIQEMTSSSKQDIIIEGHFAVGIVPKSIVHLVFVLRRNPEELKTVLESRGFKGDRLWENLAAEILDVCLCDAVSLYGAGKVCEVDVTGRSVEEVVKDMVSTLNNEKECRVGLVDWLGRLEDEGKLDEYLKHF